MKERQTKPILGITVGDLAGIGPEIVMQSLGMPQLWDDVAPLLFSSRSLMEEIAREMRYPCHFTDWTPGMIPSDPRANEVSFFNVGDGFSRPPFGKASACGGQISLASITQAAQLALSGKIDALVTAPISKESLKMAGSSHIGHTDLLAHLAGVSEYAMMLTVKGLYVVHATEHMSLVKACAALSCELLYKKILLSLDFAQKYGLTDLLAVCALNPHAGENEMFGDEETKIILPAIQRAQAQGRKVLGPFPADTIFNRAMQGDFKLILALYHDQGHIPIKVLGLMEGVNVTIGLPFIRTSVDHGTAFGKAGQGKANPRSLVAAIELAKFFVRLSEGKNKK